MAGRAAVAADGVNKKAKPSKSIEAHTSSTQTSKLQSQPHPVSHHQLPTTDSIPPKPTMSPQKEPKIRVALIGLSASAITSWASTAHLPNLLSPSGQSRFQIVALCNSSLSAAHAAIAAYNLDPLTTRAYGDPDSLAHDEEVDLVLVNTRVDKHLETALPSVRAGRDVFVEWPVGRDQGEVGVLRGALKDRESAGEKKGRVLVGLQGRWAPPVVKIGDLLREGKIGRLLSSKVEAYGGSRDREVLPVGLKYFAERKVGGNPITIGFGHGKISLCCFVVCFERY